jgi:hypothetical protein
MMLQSTTLELQPFLLDTLIPLPLTQNNAPQCGIVDNDDMYYGYLALKIMITHKFKNNKQFSAAHRRTMYILTTCHTSLAPEPYYALSGLEQFGVHVSGHAKQQTNKEYIPKRYGIWY